MQPQSIFRLPLAPPPVEQVVVHFDLCVGLEVIRKEHDGNGNLVQIVDLGTQKHTRTRGAPT